MKNTLSLLTGFLVYSTFAYLLFGYENIKMHTSINEAIVDWFLYKSPVTYTQSNTLLSLSTESFTGLKVVKSGMTSVDEQTEKLTPREWIIHGGFSADTPELNASLRHFYDPVKIDGVSYLTDLVENISIKTGEPLPKMNAKDWALSAPDNLYTWDKGKHYLKLAFEANSEELREASIAKAYRALGETLHLFADMGCPPHVRNDAHPAVLTADALGYRIYYGDPDPYEELIKAEDVTDWALNSHQPASDVVDKFRKAVTASELFEIMALFTNQNFFSEDTQFGDGVIPNINDRREYPSPKIGADVQYDASDNYYYKVIDERSIKMCVSKSYFFGGKYPTIDLASIISQASILLPTIVEGGANVMRLFTPKMKIQITKAQSDGVLEGSIEHIVDAEFKNEIKYNGAVKIYKGEQFIGDAVSVNGLFSAGTLSVQKGDDIYAVLTVGGIKYTSDEFEVEEVSANSECYDKLTTMSRIRFYISANTNSSANEMMLVSWPLLRSGTAMPYPSDYKLDQITWSGNNFSYSNKFITSGSFAQSEDTLIMRDTLDYSFTGTLAKDASSIQFFSLKYKIRSRTDIHSIWNYPEKQLRSFIENEISINNLPATATCGTFKIASAQGHVGTYKKINYTVNYEKNPDTGKFEQTDITRWDGFTVTNYTEAYIKID